jgi:tetratricopeptide (TPR) repeat protein
MEAGSRHGRMEIMKLFLFRDYCKAIIGILVCMAICTASAQLPSKEEPAPRAGAISDESSPVATLGAMEAALRSELTAHPESAPVLYKLGQILRLENRPKESLEVYTRAAALQKPDAGQLRSVALDYVVLNDFKDAIHWLEIARSFEPRNVEVLYSLGRCYYSQARYHEAEGLFVTILQIKPDHLKAEENLGLTYDVENQPEKAEPALRKAVEWTGRETTDEWPFLDLGTFLLAHDRPGDAVAYLQRAASIAPKCAACREKLGRAFVATGRASDGVKELEAAVQLDPKDPKIHFELGRAYRAAGALAKSRAEFAVSQTLYGEHSRN